MKTKAILLHQMKANTLDELDFGGALVFLLSLGCLHLMVGSCMHENMRVCLQICTCNMQATVRDVYRLPFIGCIP